MTAPKKPSAKAPATRRRAPAAARARQAPEPTPRVFSSAEQQAALEGRRRGLAYGRIAAALSNQPGSEPFTADEARLAYEAALAADLPDTDPTSTNLLELSRADAVLAGIWPKASAGDPAAVDRFIRVSEWRQRLLGEPTRVKNAITDAFEKSLAALGDRVKDEDETLVATARQVARQIDHAVAHGTSMEATKAMYLLPHLLNALRELGATPAARAVLEAAVPARADPDTPEAAGASDAPVSLSDWKKAART